MSRGDPTIPGTYARPLARPTRTYRAGRVCGRDGCETRLSIYNRASYCWLHEPVGRYLRARPWGGDPSSVIDGDIHPGVEIRPRSAEVRLSGTLSERGGMGDGSEC